LHEVTTKCNHKIDGIQFEEPRQPIIVDISESDHEDIPEKSDSNVAEEPDSKVADEHDNEREDAAKESESSVVSESDEECLKWECSVAKFRLVQPEKWLT
jgi:hypothetical protein